MVMPCLPHEVTGSAPFMVQPPAAATASRSTRVGLIVPILRPGQLPPAAAASYLLLRNRQLGEHLLVGAQLVKVRAALVAALWQLGQLGALFRRELEFGIAAAGQAGLERVGAR